MRRKRALFLSLFAVAGCGGNLHYDYAHEPNPKSEEYVIGVADGLKISVWKNPDLSVEVHVRPDGTITLPLIGDVPASGRSPSQLKAALAKLLTGYVKDENAIVTVAVTDANSYRFSVSGNVEHAGLFESKYYVTVAEAIAIAGGENKFASPRVTLIRRDARGLRRIPFDYRRISGGLHPEEDITVVSGDSIVIE